MFWGVPKAELRLVAVCSWKGISALSRRVAWETAVPSGHHAGQCGELPAGTAAFIYCFSPDHGVRPGWVS